MRPLFRWLAVFSALGFLGLYVLQAQQNAQKETSAAEAERLKRPALAPGSKALAPATSEGVFAPGSKSGRIVPTPKSAAVAPSSKMMILPSSKRGEVRLPVGLNQTTPTPVATPTPTASPATTPVPTTTPTPGPLK